MMKSQGVIYFGPDPRSVLSEAYRSAIAYMVDGASLPVSSIERFVQTDTYPNFFRLKKSDEENEISIDAAREMINFLSQKPSLPGNRAVIIEDFENMSRNAANSILKILEEPPLDSVLILTTTRLLSILPTIRSRCLKVRVNSESMFPTSDCSDVESFIRKILKDFDQALISQFITFIKSGCRNFLAFAKANAENFEAFFQVALAYCSYKSSIDADLSFSRKLLKLQSFFTLSRNTYPDKQSGIVAVCLILTGTCG